MTDIAARTAARCGGPDIDGLDPDRLSLYRLSLGGVGGRPRFDRIGGLEVAATPERRTDLRRKLGRRPLVEPEPGAVL
ncbi:hypothetical protein JYK22_15415 [Nonomuraea sp. RK-328]|nr:hypothetical protein [Nonomuraea sp. RK-328]